MMKSPSGNPRATRLLLRLATAMSLTILTIGLLGCFVMAAGSFKNQCSRDGPFPAESVPVAMDSEGKRSLGLWPLWRQCTWTLENGGEVTVVESWMYRPTVIVYGLTSVGAAGYAYTRYAKRSARRTARKAETDA